MMKSPFTNSNSTKTRKLNNKQSGDHKNDSHGKKTENDQLLEAKWHNIFGQLKLNDGPKPSSYYERGYTQESMENAPTTPEKNDSLVHLNRRRSSFKLCDDLNDESSRSSFDFAQKNLNNSLPKNADMECQDLDVVFPSNGRQDATARSIYQRAYAKPECEENSFEYDRTPSMKVSKLESDPNVEYTEAIRDTHTTMSFKRKYHPLKNVESLQKDSDTDQESSLKTNSNKSSESRVDRILRIMNTASESDHRIRMTKTSPKKDYVSTYSNDSTSQFPTAHQNYSFYALFFMVGSNLVGLLLSLTYQVLLFLKLNADHFLYKSWQQWQNASIVQGENNILVLMMMLPLLLFVMITYASVWAAFSVNRMLLTSVPDRLADMINFNIHIIQS